MAENTLLYEIEQLPDNLKLKTLHYIYQLKKEYMDVSMPNNSAKRIFGRVKGKYKLAPDFDEALEDFKDYI
ncbi:MAG: DUF2281 domain-containing protein [Ignavibacteria bacterium]|nr:DUF2281 domain-containing protein [Ignavibacteria bacterium]